ncbi:amino acid decarboxylase [Gryllotalpicola sp.]|uniref:aminotransferase class I/II-fold pyridoxal phosphate-dependent enzyme n=1 Tax=Gryllotalpicola sp. TaxID=1932787 RepID=UPI002609EAE2|nr:amino acid decarboxylase [Gryllotalpicola sp.]
MTHADDPGTPFADALERFAALPLQRMIVPGHAADPAAAPDMARYFGERLLALDVAKLVPGIDLEPDSPFYRSQALAAEAWGGSRTWFLTNGSSQANRIAALALGFYRSSADPVVVQRSTHSSFVDGIILAGLDARYVAPSLDRRLGIAHGVSVGALRDALDANPGAKAAYVVSPSYFGATADIPALAALAHERGMPLIVDGAWGAHYGFHPALPPSPLTQGADLVVMSTHKLGGSFTQSAMLHLGWSEFARELEPLVERGFALEQSTSESALLLASLDLARHTLATGRERIGASLDLAERLRTLLRAGGRYRIASDGFGAFDDIVAVDPSRVSIDTAAAGLSGHTVREALLERHHVQFELSTDATVLAIIGPGTHPDVEAVAGWLHELEPEGGADAWFQAHELPLPGEQRLLAREAAFAPSVVLPAAEAVGRVSSESLAAYPPGIPNLMPGEVITAETVAYLQHTAAAPTGHVRGALDPQVAHLRVVA